MKNLNGFKLFAISIAMLMQGMVAFAQEPVLAEEPILVLESRITGNQEQPKVLYLVPWKSETGIEALNLPLNALSEPEFKPLVRDEFIRELEFRRQWSETQAELLSSEEIFD